MSVRLEIKLLGDFALLIDGRPNFAVDTTRMRTLVAHLVLKRGIAQPRSKLAFQFWPDSSEKQALTNLRHLIHSLRKALPESERFLHTEGRNITWMADVPCSVDVVEFETAIAGGQLKLAIDHYADDLLPGYDDVWLETKREELRGLFSAALEKCMTEHENRREHALAIRCAERLRQFDPSREATHAQLMRLHALAGDRAKALKAYQECVDALRKHLDVGPSAATEALRQQLLRQEPVAPNGSPRPPTAGRPPEIPLQGRHEEWRQLRERWTHACAGSAQLVVLIGEAGIGKSRLAEELFNTLQGQGIAASRTRSYAAEGRLAYAPVCQWLRSPTLHPALASLDQHWLAEIARVIPEIAGEFPGLPQTAPESDHSRRRILFEALARATTAGGEPLLLLLDDMQWTDQETLEWLRFLLRFAPAFPLLIVGTIREEEFFPDHPLRSLLLDLGRDGQLTEIALGPVTPDDSARIAASIAGYDLTSVESARLFSATSGNPLFVVETVRAGLREDIEELEGKPFGPGLSNRLPKKVQAVFTTRLNQLSNAARELCRIAAVFGRTFSLEMLIEVSGCTEDETIGLLDELWEKRILREQEPGVYDFTHDKLREVAYEQISTPKRRLLHRKSSDVLEKVYAENLDPVMAQLASHYEEAGQLTKAIASYGRAGQVAGKVNATREAVRLLEKALGLLQRLPENVERLERELELNTSLGVFQVFELGYQAAEVQKNYERSQELCHLLDRPTSAPILRGLALYNLVAGNLHETMKLAAELRAFQRGQNDEILYVESEYLLGVTGFWLGRFAESRDYLERSIAAYKPSLSRTHIDQYAQDPKAICLCRLGWTEIMLGRLDRGLALVNESIAFARKLNHPHTEGYVLSFSGQVFLNIEDHARTRECVERFREVVAENQLPFWETRCEMMLGHLQVVEDGDRSGLQRMRENYDLCIERKHTISLSAFLVLFARTYQHLGEPQQGLQLLDTLKDGLEGSEETYFNAELLRVRGELYHTCGHAVAEVEACFDEALAVARAQGCLLLELRAALSLAELWKGQKQKRASTRRQLEEVLSRFSEGFSFPDLEAAQHFLAG